ncbi:hypothetical protein HanIR_Chr11g0552151 [Helianthus annuus]|nr:hypothetical protein HanIR_Chr11g0552151 [Helianthus annuus]
MLWWQFRRWMFDGLDMTTFLVDNEVGGGRSDDNVGGVVVVMVLVLATTDR